MLDVISREALLAQEEKELTAKKPLLRATSRDSRGSGSSFNSESKALKTIDSFVASGIDDAISLLNIATSDDVKSSERIERHPERRVKSAYAAFEVRLFILND